MNRVLALAAHPDDETLGCAGTLLKHKERGDKIYWLIATGIKEEYGFSKEQVLEREKEIKLVSDIYDFDGVYKLEFPTTRVEESPINEIIKRISQVINEIRPNIIYLPFKKDAHTDHRIIFEAAFSCSKTFRCPFIRKILMMEIISETEFSPALKEFVFLPNYFVDITDFLDKKLEIMKTYKSEIGKHPFPRSPENIKALATLRGAMAGCKYAESFMILKEIE